MKFIRAEKFKFIRKTLALKLALAFLFEICFPTFSFALTGGPSQPEVQSFEPIGTSDMVDLFSGDFTYNIPLLEVDGYPVNLSYNSGITMDQEASWVGLGWNVNPGVVNRSMRGVPDDFRGDEIEKEFNMKPNKTYGITSSVNVNAELLGAPLSLSASLSTTLKLNNYTGWGTAFSVSTGVAASQGSKMPLNANLGISVSGDEGASIQPSIGLALRTKAGQVGDKSSFGSALSLSVSGAYNSRHGLRTLTIGPSAGIPGYPRSSLENKALGTISGASFDFGLPTYTPSGELNMRTLGFTGKFELGLAGFGAYSGLSLAGFYSSQSLDGTKVTNKAYGYLNSQYGAGNNKALHDFNRENDGGFNENTPALPQTNYTFDIFSVSGQGVGGSYRAFRNDIGTVYDPQMKGDPDIDFNIEAELGAGNIAHVGVVVGGTVANSKSELWSDAASAALSFKHSAGMYEAAYFKEANEKNVLDDLSFFNSTGGFDAVAIDLAESGGFNVLAQNKWRGGSNNQIGSNMSAVRKKRSQLFSYLSKSEAKTYGVDEMPENVHDFTNQSTGHHIGEVTNLSADGSRYVYGIPAYNTLQEEVTFAVGEPFGGSSSLSARDADCTTGLVNYVPGDNSTSNQLGLDNYFSKTSTPAYAHSYLLTAILSPDYVDADNIKGPSDNDLGNYTKFEYNKINGYKWRTPEGANQATYNQGMKSDIHDDKGTYVYGEKELWYLEKVISKNHIAVFHTSDRSDGRGVAGRDGGIDQATAMQKLDKIELYSKVDYQTNGEDAVPLKTVHFKYGYSLCPGVQNYYQTPDDDNLTGAKLTLKEVYFTYQNSNKARYSGYKFNYDTPNPTYDIQAYDRWGCYKPNAPSCNIFSEDYPNNDYPYVEQDKETADLYSQSWHLSGIQLPSGGEIRMEYESDDYAYVQDKKAMQMFKIVGAGGINSSPGITNISNNPKLYFELHPDANSSEDIGKYVEGIEHVYFKALMNFPQLGNDNFEYVPGYAKIVDYGYEAGYGYLNLKKTHLVAQSLDRQFNLESCTYPE